VTGTSVVHLKLLDYPSVATETRGCDYVLSEGTSFL